MNNEQQQCTREDLRVEIIANAYVNDLGQPVIDEYSERTSGINDIPKPYWCSGECGEHGLGTSFATWEEALAHVGKAGEDIERQPAKKSVGRPFGWQEDKQTLNESEAKLLRRAAEGDRDSTILSIIAKFDKLTAAHHKRLVEKNRKTV
jgi:hypothetical protein